MVLWFYYIFLASILKGTAHLYFQPGTIVCLRFIAYFTLLFYALYKLGLVWKGTIVMWGCTYGASAAVLDFTIPQGAKGDKGEQGTGSTVDVEVATNSEIDNALALACFVIT